MRNFPLPKQDEFRIFKRLTTPSKVQDFLDTFPINFEEGGDTCQSPLRTLRNKKAQCIEGAILAAAIFWYHGEKPLLLDLKTTKDDDDHILALFRSGGKWGAVSKTNHAVLRYRDPIYASVRELAITYFNEYFLDSGKKTLRSFSVPFSLLHYDDEWLTMEDDLWGIYEDIDTVRHFPIMEKRILKRLRLADAIEIKAGKIVEWSKPDQLATENLTDV